MKVKNLVLDTAAFVKNVPIWEYGVEFYSMEAVVEEIKDKATREHVQALPVPVTMREPRPESIRFISEFSQKVGDFSSLSVVDIKVLALTYELEVETKGSSDHLRKTPQQAVTQVHTAKKVKDPKANIEGFYMPKSSEEGSTEAYVRKSPSIHELNELTLSHGVKSEIIAKKDPGDLVPCDCSEIKCCCSSQTLCSISDHLANRSYLLGFSLSLLDLTVSSHVLAFGRKNNSDVLYEDKIHLQRWMRHVTHLLEDGEQFKQTSYQEVENFLNSLNITCPLLVVEVKNGSTDDKSSVVEVNENEESNIDTENFNKVNQDEHNIKDCVENCNTGEDRENFENGDSREDSREVFDSPQSDSEQGEEENEDNDDEGWITPSNIKKLKETSPEDEEEEDVLVACMTADFAMQNVLKQIGLSVLGVSGKVIRHCKTYILRCHACFKTATDMSKVFCSRCGHKSLKKVAVTLNPDGSQKIWISSRPINTKGMKFSLPTPKGGQHALNPVLVADQREAQKMASKLGRKKTDPLSEDYDASLSPFATRDVYSKAAQMGYRAGKNHTLKYWEQHNPNVPLRRTGKKKK